MHAVKKSAASSTTPSVHSAARDPAASSRCRATVMAARRDGVRRGAASREEKATLASYRLRKPTEQPGRTAPLHRQRTMDRIRVPPLLPPARTPKSSRPARLRGLCLPGAQECRVRWLRVPTPASPVTVRRTECRLTIPVTRLMVQRTAAPPIIPPSPVMAQRTEVPRLIPVTRVMDRLLDLDVGRYLGNSGKEPSGERRGPASASLRAFMLLPIGKTPWSANGQRSGLPTA
jgi:hypothetical protein